MAETRKNQWLLDHARNVHSQKGEDGILDKVFEFVPVTGSAGRWCVEFGAWDGKHLSNTYNLMENKGWSGVFIEGDPARVVDLKKTYGSNPKAHPVQAFVAFSGPSTLDEILAKTPIPKGFDLLSIDIDGNDYHIWDSVSRYQPKAVIIEHNPTIPPHIEFVQPRDMKVNQGSSLAALVRLGTKKGYELVSVTNLNAIFVRKEYFPAFGIADNSPEALFTDRSCQTSLFSLYDGTIMIAGRDWVGWHGVPISRRRIQMVPRIFRVFPSVMSLPRLLAFRIWRKVRTLGKPAAGSRPNSL